MISIRSCARSLQIGRDVPHLQRGLKIAARHFVGAEPIIKDAELEAHARQRRIVEQKLLIGADRGLDIVRRRAGGILQRIVEIGRPRQDALKQRTQISREIGWRLGGGGKCRKTSRPIGARAPANRRQNARRASTCKMSPSP